MDGSLVITCGSPVGTQSLSFSGVQPTGQTPSLSWHTGAFKLTSQSKLKYLSPEQVSSALNLIWFSPVLK